MWTISVLFNMVCCHPIRFVGRSYREVGNFFCQVFSLKDLRMVRYLMICRHRNPN